MIPAANAREFISPLMFDRFPPEIQEKLSYWYKVYRTPRPRWYRPLKRIEWDTYQKTEIPLLLDLRRVGQLLNEVEQKEKKPGTSIHKGTTRNLFREKRK